MFIKKFGLFLLKSYRFKLINLPIKKNVFFNFFYSIFCCCVFISQKQASISALYFTLKKCLSTNYSFFLNSSASKTAAMQYISVYSGITISEFFSFNGWANIIIFDDLSKQIVAYRQLSLLLRRPPGREAYSGDCFFIHSRLLERCVKLNELTFGGGSISGLPIIETQGGDLSGFIPTNVVSITDGQIFLESSLFYKGILPAVNYGLSVSRVGSAAQPKVLKKIAGSLKLKLAQFRELESFAKFGSDLDSRTQAILTRGFRLIEILKQKQFLPVLTELQVLFIYSVINGFVDLLPVSQVVFFLEKLMVQFFMLTQLYVFFKKTQFLTALVPITSSPFYFSETGFLLFLSTKFLGSFLVKNLKNNKLVFLFSNSLLNVKTNFFFKLTPIFLFDLLHKNFKKLY